MKLRQVPEDFKVFEIRDIDSIDKAKEDEYKLFLLEKKGLETFALINDLSNNNNIPYKEFGIAGLKDKHALTEQYFTIPSKYDIKTLKGNGFSIKFIGFLDKKISLGDLEGNRFEIVVRDITKGELEGIQNKAKRISEIGVPNYFDSQRFGSVVEGTFIAKFLMKKEYESAMKTYLTSFPKAEIASIKEDKRFIYDNWNDINKRNRGDYLKQIRNYELRTIINVYMKSGKWLEAFKYIKPGIREIIISAYQSYLWNECAKIVLNKHVDPKKLYAIDYNVGQLVYYKNLSIDERKNIPKFFKTISDRMKLSEEEASIIESVLSKEGITLNDFNIRNKTSNFFKTHEREIIIFPEHFSLSEPEPDELNKKSYKNPEDGPFKMKLSFTLPKGSYATLITKRVFGQ